MCCSEANRCLCVDEKNGRNPICCVHKIRVFCSDKKLSIKGLTLRKPTRINRPPNEGIKTVFYGMPRGSKAHELCRIKLRIRNMKGYADGG